MSELHGEVEMQMLGLSMAMDIMEQVDAGVREAILGDNLSDPLTMIGWNAAMFGLFVHRPDDD